MSNTEPLFWENLFDSPDKHPFEAEMRQFAKLRK